MSTPPNDPVIDITRSILTEAAQRPWLAALLMRRRPDWLTRLAHLAQRVRNLPRHTRRALRRKLASGLAAAALLLALAGTPTAYAADITVVFGAVGIADDGNCSLAEAIIAANTHSPSGLTPGECLAGDPGANTIRLPAFATFDYAIAYGSSAALPDITSQITIEANGSTIERPADNGGYFRILTVVSTGDLTLNQATITGGGVIGSGGGISNTGTLTVTSSTITGNTATNGYGGGIFNNGTLTVQDSTISSNTASGSSNGGGGGGIYNYSGTLTVQDSHIISNTADSDGGGIYSSGASASVTVQGSDIISNTSSSDGGGISNTGTLTVQGNSTIRDNTAAYSGGGIFNGNGPVTVQNSTIISNTAQNGGGIYTTGTLTVQGGDIISNTADSNGGGIYSSGASASVTIQGNSTIISNTADSDGGGIWNHYGTLTVQDSDIISNTADAGGGGIWNYGTLTVTNSTLSGNEAGNGGGIYHNAGTLDVQNSTLSGNEAGNGGGGIRIWEGAMTVQDSDIISNTAGSGGGIYNCSGMLDVQDSTLSGNKANDSGEGGANGGGIYNSATLTVQDSTLSGNAANNSGGFDANGGGIYNSGTLTVTNSTISGNAARAVAAEHTAGGGIYNSNTLMVTHSTIANNDAYNVDSDSEGGGIDGTATISNSIVAGNTLGTDGNDCSEPLTSGGYNIESGESCGFDPAVVDNHDQWDIDPVVDLKLQPLANNGNKPHPFTHALGTGSVAIDKIPKDTNGCVAGTSLDERGALRAADDVPLGSGTGRGGTACDIGAYEVSNQTPTAVNLAAFTAARAGDHNLLAWETVSELRNLGFNVWRGTSAGAPEVKLNPYVIPSQAPGGTDGFVYHYSDFAIASGANYYYWLEDVDLNGTVTRHGPVLAVVNGPTAVTLGDFAATAPTSPGVIGAALAALAALGALLFGRRVKGKSQP